MSQALITDTNHTQAEHIHPQLWEFKMESGGSALRFDLFCGVKTTMFAPCCRKHNRTPIGTKHAGHSDANLVHKSSYYEPPF